MQADVLLRGLKQLSHLGLCHPQRFVFQASFKAHAPIIALINYHFRLAVCHFCLSSIERLYPFNRYSILQAYIFAYGLFVSGVETCRNALLIKVFPLPLFA